MPITHANNDVYSTTMSMHSKELEIFRDIISSSPEIMSLLRRARTLNLESWCLGAGVIRDYVWDTLQGNSYTKPNDVDLVYYDASSDDEKKLSTELNSIADGNLWEVTNQAKVHEWYVGEDGRQHAPFRSMLEAIASWPEYCTAVGVALSSNNDLSVYAPYGLEDLLSFKVRHNPLRAGLDTFKRRSSKFSRQRWPLLEIQTDYDVFKPTTKPA